MCIIIIQPKGYSFTDEQIEDFYERNSQGFGFMWIDDEGSLKGIRGVPRDAQHAIAMYRQYADGLEGVIHYRFATSGPVNKEMAHPFAVSRDLFVVHNGVLPGGNKDESDTFQFVRDTLRPLLGADYSRLYDPEVQAQLSVLIRGSSLVFLDSDGRVTRLGSKGVEWDGCWYSNTYAWTTPKELGGGWADDEGWWCVDEANIADLFDEFYDLGMGLDDLCAYDEDKYLALMDQLQADGVVDEYGRVVEGYDEYAVVADFLARSHAEDVDDPLAHPQEQAAKRRKARVRSRP